MIARLSVLVASAGFGLLAFAGSALAHDRHRDRDWDRDDRRWDRGDRDDDDFGVFIGPGGIAIYRGDDGYWRDKRYRAPRGYGYGPPYAYGGYGPPPPPCQTVWRWGRWNGYRAKIGATLCYDAWGRGYVVPGSEYPIEYVGPPRPPYYYGGW